MAEYECLEDFVPDIQMEVADIDKRTILMMLGVAQAKFCRDTRVLSQEVDLLLEAGKFTYPCIPQWEGFNQTVDLVLTGITQDSLNAITFNDQYTISPDRNSIILDEGYMQEKFDGYALKIISTVIPYKATQAIDTDVYELYGFILITLAKQLIYNMKGRTWSNAVEAEGLLWEYNEMLNTVQFDNAAGGNTSGDQSINLDVF